MTSLIAASGTAPAAKRTFAWQQRRAASFGTQSYDILLALAVAVALAAAYPLLFG